MAKSTLPIEVHDHFRKANVLHGYVLKGLGEATKWALETGQELLLAKTAVPHGSWEKECERLFDGSLRNAQFYMQFAKNMMALPKAQGSALLFLETTLEGAAKAARDAARGEQPPKPEPEPEDEPEQESEAELEPDSDETEDEQPPPPAPDYGKCPNCQGTHWDEDDEGVSCAKCHHPHGEPAGDVDDKQLGIQRSKVVKTVEALMRAFDDLQAMRAKSEHDAAIDGCKALLKLAKNWK